MTKAIILAAGQGIRLRPYTDNAPKCMVPYNGRPIIDHILETLDKCGITDITIVGGYRIDVLKDHLKDKKGLKFYLNEYYDRTNMVTSLFCAEKELTDDLVISYSDIVYGTDILSPLLKTKDDFAVTADMNWRLLWEKRMHDPLQDAETFKMDTQGYVTELGKKPKSFEDIQGQYMGLIWLGKKILPEVISTYHSMDKTLTYDNKNFDNMFMTSFIQFLVDNGLKLKAIPTRGTWMEIDTLQDLDVKF